MMKRSSTVSKANFNALVSYSTKTKSSKNLKEMGSRDTTFGFGMTFFKNEKSDAEKLADIAKLSKVLN
jgi:hypothetical protein